MAITTTVSFSFRSTLSATHYKSQQTTINTTYQTPIPTAYRQPFNSSVKTAYCTTIEATNRLSHHAAINSDDEATFFQTIKSAFNQPFTKA